MVGRIMFAWFQGYVNVKWVGCFVSFLYMCVCVFLYISMVPDKWSIQEIIFYICYTKYVAEPA